MGKEAQGMTDKCDDCRSWAMQCEINGDRRRYCIRYNYKLFKPKYAESGQEE